MSSGTRSRISSNVRSVRTKRMPQLMSKPIPPGEMTPWSGSIAAKPPIGKPEPCGSPNGKEGTMSELRVELPPEVPVEEARLLLMAKLFETGRLSLGQAAKSAGYSKAAFIELLGKLGMPVFDYAAEELRAE